MHRLDIQLETPRLILRVPKAGDFPRFADMFEDAGTHHIGGPLLRHEAWRRFLQMPGAWVLQGFAMFSVIEKSSGLWVGHAGPWQPDGWPGTEVGYSFHRDAHGKGYATESCIAAMDWVFNELGWADVIHSIAPTNHASQSVAKRLGSRYRGPGKLPAPLDMHPIDLWGQTREQWFARGRPGVAVRSLSGGI